MAGDAAAAAPSATAGLSSELAVADARSPSLSVCSARVVFTPLEGDALLEEGVLLRENQRFFFFDVGVVLVVVGLFASAPDAS